MAYKPDKTTKSGSKGSGSGRNQNLRRDAPVSATTSGKLRGGNRNVSATRTPKSRPGYPHLLEAATSTMHLATQGGLSPSWRATLANLLTRPGMETYQQFAEYNCSLVDASRERLLRRQSLQRFLTPTTRGGVEFYARNGQGALISETTGTDGILAVDAWHSEFSAEFGRFVKFMEFNLDVNQIFHEQRGHGEYGLGPGYRKAAGQPYTPYERLYDLLYARLEPVITSLNIPSHLLANMTLGDVVRHTLNLLAPSSIGLDSNTWTMPTGFNIHLNGYLQGYHSLDFGSLTDADGNPRYLVQIPENYGGLENMSSNDDHNSTVRSARVPLSDLYHLGPNATVSFDAAAAVARMQMRADLSAYLAAPETDDDVYIQGVNLRSLPGSADFFRQSNLTINGVPTMEMAYMYGLSSSWSTTLTSQHTVQESTAQARDITTYAITGNRTLKLWTASPLVWLDYMHAVSSVLPPEYLATGVQRLTEFSAPGGLTAALPYGELVDMLNLNAHFKMRFNPVKLIEQNNGPFGRDANGTQFSDAWREQNWEAPAKIGGNTHARHLAVLEQIFSGTTFETGYGTAAETVASILALLNPRWLEALFTLSNRSAVDKRERYVTVPANRASIAAGYISEEGAFALNHHLMILNRLVGTFACYSTMPFTDIDYGTATNYYRGSSVTVLGSGTATDNYYQVEDAAPLALGDLNQPNLGYGSGIVGLPASGLSLKLGWEVSSDFDGLEFTLEPQVQPDGTHRYTIADNKLTVPAYSALSSALMTESQLFNDSAFRCEIGGTVHTFAIVSSRVVRSGPVKQVELLLSGFGGGSQLGTLVVEYTAASSGSTYIKLGASDARKTITDAITASGLTKSVWNVTAIPDEPTMKALMRTDVSWAWAKNVTIVSGEAEFFAATGLASGAFTDVQFEGISFVAAPSSNWHVRAFPDMESAVGTPADPEPLNPVGAPVVPAASIDGLCVRIQSDADFGGLTHSIDDAALGILWKYFGYYTPDGVNVARRSGLWVATGTDRNRLAQVGADSSNFDGGRYWMSQNEDVFFDARRNEFDAAVYDYSGLRLFNLYLNPEYGGYPYHGETEGFMRDLILELTPAIVDYHFQSASPFLIPGLARLKVDKTIYNPQAYAIFYQNLVGMAGNARTEITIEDLRRAQDVLVRRSQGGL